MTKVDVIVPIYNAEKSLEQTLDALVTQSLRDIRIVCINDGSTDSSQAILESYRAKYPERIEVFYKPNGGIADARNYGLLQVKAPYFGFVDSDDVVEETMFEDLLLEAERTQADIVTSDFYWSYPNYEKLAKDGAYDSKKNMLTHVFATLWNKLYRTDFIKSIGIEFPSGYRYEDASFIYKLIPNLKSWSYVEKPFVHYRQTSGSITHVHNERVKDMIYVFQDLIDYYKATEYYDSYHSELEYLFIRFFLGNSFLRTCQIKDPRDRKITLKLSYGVLTRNFPNWRANPYLQNGGLKNLYFKFMNRFNYGLSAFVFTLFFMIFKKKVF